MPSGGGGQSDYLIINALQDYLRRAGVSVSSRQVYNLYTALKAQYQNANISMLDENGRLKYDFVASITEAASQGDFLAQREGGYLGDAAAADAEAGEDGELEVPPPPQEEVDLAAAEASRLNARTGFRSILRLYGITITDNIQSLMEEATRKGYDQYTFLFYLQKTPEYNERFVGIFNEDGSLKMSEAQYLANERQYEDLASRYGVHMGENLTQWLFTNDVSPSEFSDRAPAIKLIKTNPELYQQFSKALVQAGVVGKVGEVTKKELMKFVLGEGNPEWYKVWNLSRARYVATQAGITIGKGADQYLGLNPGVIESIAKKGLSDEALSAGFAQYAEQARTVLSTQEARLYGVDKKDLVAAAFGGKKSGLAAGQIQRAIDTYKAFQEERASAQTFVGEEGLGILSGVQRKGSTEG